MKFGIRRRAAAALLSGAVLLAAAAVTLAAPRQYTVVAPDGVTLSVQESGSPEGSPIILVHGLLGSRLSWSLQLKSAALQRHRLITYDLRGHGLSDKPAEAAAYTDGRRWGDDLAAVIDATQAEKPVLVGWSLGAAVISNYLATHGDSHLGGVVYADGVIELTPDQITPHAQVYQDMTSTDLATHLEGERAFLRLCFHRPPDQATFDRLVGVAALASWTMQRAVPSMSVAAAAGLGKAHVPVLLIYGAQDALVKANVAIARAVSLNPRIQSRVYAGSGHAPFLEEPGRFNRDLAGFVDAVAPAGTSRADAAAAGQPGRQPVVGTTMTK